jgi:hypothetical protein
MPPKRFNIGEARRVLPELVRTVAEQGGRIDITYRGEARVSLLRTSDLALQQGVRSAGLPGALRIELAFPAQALPGVLRELRATQGKARADWLVVPTSGRTRKPVKRRPP